ncbi:MAG: hypothetical protein GY811_06960 [Myxococcales bacterium]|nr:hypothetical protein [Myxococcales bacterium]
MRTLASSLALAFVFACSGGSGPSGSVGGEGGACYENGTCDDGLQCQGDVCNREPLTDRPLAADARLLQSRGRCPPRWHY